MEQEKGASGKQFVDHVSRHVLAGYAFEGVPVTGSKEVRAAPLAAQAEAGHVKVLRAPWNGAFFDELEGFPNGTHDDQVDAAAGAYLDLAMGSAGQLRTFAGPGWTQ
jgi:predicted phage terminase large subunit-like protein